MSFGRLGRAESSQTRSSRRGLTRQALVLSLLGLAGLFWLIQDSVWRIERNEQGVVLRFGKVVRSAPSGIALTWPRPIETLRRISMSEVRSLAVGGALSDEDLGLAELAAADVRSHWLTGDTNVVDLQLSLQYTVSNARDYLLSLEAGEDHEDLLRMLAESVVTSHLSDKEILDVLGAGKVELRQSVKQELQALLNELQVGLQLVSVNVVQSAPPAQVVGSFNDVTTASTDRQREITRADGYRRDQIPTERARALRLEVEAENYKVRKVGQAQGETEAFRSLLAKVQSAPDPAAARRRIWIDRVTEVLAKSTKQVFPAGQPMVYRRAD